MERNNNNKKIRDGFIAINELFRYYDVNNQKYAIIFSFVNLFNSALHVLGDKFAHPQEHFFDCIYSFWYNAPTLLPNGATVEMELRSISTVSTIKFSNL